MTEMKQGNVTISIPDTQIGGFDKLNFCILIF